jgi:hypothetical protein
MSTSKETTARVTEMLGELRRLVEALDRRVPRAERSGEARIAQESADLRGQALTLIRCLEEELEARGTGPT